MSKFTPKQTTRKTITEQTYKLLTNNHLVESVNDLYSKLWHNPLTHSSLRLSNQGYLIFCESLAIESYVFTTQQDYLPLKLLLQIEKKLTRPYYLHTNKKRQTIAITLFGEHEAMLMLLNDKNLEKFLERI